ncbi:AhpA/YtjB family protein [Shewanella algae]|uniref:AhpA/YtjB family protein n=1 Tax=Shewanella algae TaxID=38313 RepID=UPI000D1B7D80|nr:AhpA/YtjB family protein [Shewanella algae]
MLFKGLKKSQKISRLLQIAIAVTLLVGLIQLWQTSLLQGQRLLKTQTQKMARLLVQQTAYGAAPALQLQNDEQLQWLASALVEDPKVMAATIYSENGQRLSFAQDVSPELLEPDSPELDDLLAPYPPYVEPVIQQGKNLGFVEVRLDPKLFFNEIKEAHELNMEQQQLMLIVAGFIGLLLSRALSFKRADFDRRRTRVKRRRKKLKQQEKATAKEAADTEPTATESQDSAPDTGESQTELEAESNTNMSPKQAEQPAQASARKVARPEHSEVNTEPGIDNKTGEKVQTETGAETSAPQIDPSNQRDQSNQSEAKQANDSLIPDPVDADDPRGKRPWPGVVPKREPQTAEANKKNE